MYSISGKSCRMSLQNLLNAFLFLFRKAEDYLTVISWNQLRSYPSRWPHSIERDNISFILSLSLSLVVFKCYRENIFMFGGKLFPLFDGVMFMDRGEDFQLEKWMCWEKSPEREKSTLASWMAISKVPTVSMFEAMIGMPSYDFLLLRNVNWRVKSTSARLFSVDRLGRMRTSLKSSFTSLSICGMIWTIYL